jgi:hypothetical protein
VAPSGFFPGFSLLGDKQGEWKGEHAAADHNFELPAAAATATAPRGPSTLHGVEKTGSGQPPARVALAAPLRGDEALVRSHLWAMS